MLREFANVVTTAARRSIERLKAQTLQVWARGMALDNLVVKAPAMICVAAGIVGLYSGALVAGLLLALVAVVWGGLLLTVVAAGLLTGGVLRAFELARLSARGVTLECRSCNERVNRPVYVCMGHDHAVDSGCGARHKNLVPGPLGTLHRICRCGRSLPTLLLLGKDHLVALCNHCGTELPRRGFTAPTLHIPVTGGPGVGKSVFMFSAVKRLFDEHEATGSDTDFWADTRFVEEFKRAQEGIADPERMRKTTETRPSAYTIYVGSAGKRRRLLYLFDSAGEIFDKSDDLAQAEFFTHTGGVVLCIDPFSLAGLRRQVDRATLDQVRSRASDPRAVLERLTENLREASRGSGKLRLRIAVVLTKADALVPAGVAHPYAALTAPEGQLQREARSAAAQTWISEVGVRDDIVTSLLTNYAAVSFFVVSHRDAIGRTAGPSPHDDPAAPLHWLLA